MDIDKNLVRRHALGRLSDCEKAEISLSLCENPALEIKFEKLLEEAYYDSLYDSDLWRMDFVYLANSLLQRKIHEGRAELASCKSQGLAPKEITKRLIDVFHFLKAP